MAKNDNTTILIIIIVLVVFLGSGFGMMGFGGMGGFGMMNWMMYGGYGFNIFSLIFNILITIALVLLISWLVKKLQTPRGRK